MPNDPSRSILKGDEDQIYDLNNRDAQFERYKNLMTSKYYNLNANSTPLSEGQGPARYELPAPFSYMNIISEQRKDMIGQLKNSSLAGPAPSIPDDFAKQV